MWPSSLEAKRAVVLDHSKYRTQAVALERRLARAQAVRNVVFGHQHVDCT